MNSKATFDHLILKERIRKDGRSIRRIAEDAGFPPHVLYHARFQAKHGKKVNRGTVALVASALSVDAKFLLKGGQKAIR